MYLNINNKAIPINISYFPHVEKFPLTEIGINSKNSLVDIDWKYPVTPALYNPISFNSTTAPLVIADWWDFCQGIYLLKSI